MPWNPDADPITNTPPAQPPPQPPNVLPASAPSVGTNNGTISFSNSAYGGMIPIIYGADRVAANVFWASAPENVTGTINDVDYSYQTIDFAAGLCEGVINNILRIWVGEGNLVVDNTCKVDDNGVAQPAADGLIGSYLVDLTDPNGPFAALPQDQRATKISIFLGSETQIAESVMVAAEGYELTPAYRGLAYVLFENVLLSSGSIPALLFEVVSHTSTKPPRLYGDFIDTTFDTWRRLLLAYDPSYDRFYTVGSKTSPAARGLTVWNANALTELAQFEIDNANSIGPSYETTVVCKKSGLLVTYEPSANRGILYSINPLSGGVLDTLGPGGGLTGNFTTGAFIGFGTLDPGGLKATVCNRNFAGVPIPVDVLVGVGALNSSVGVATVDDSGVITMLAAEDFNGVLPEVHNEFGIYTYIASATTRVNGRVRSFYDGVSAIGTHVYGFSYASNEATSFKVWRLTLSSPDASLTSPVYKQLADIPIDAFGGTGFEYSIRGVMVNPVDAGFILIVETTSGDRGPYLAKYDPFVGGLAWVTPVSTLPASVAATHTAEFALLNGAKYAWIDGAGHVWEINLSTGALREVYASLSGQDLPAEQDALQFFNAYENSITYFTNTADKHLSKFFVDRMARSTIELSDIVTDLVGRTGLLPSDIVVDDISGLTIHGYTVAQVQTIRACFAELGQVFTYDTVESNGRLLFKTRGLGIDAVVDHNYVGGTSNGDQGSAWLKVTQINDGARIRKLNLTYKDIDRDYSQNVQSVLLPQYGVQVFDPEASIDVQVPIVMDADQARGLAEILLYAKLTYNTTYEFTLAPRYIELDPADVITITMPVGEDDVTVRLRTVTVQTSNTLNCQASEENLDIYQDQLDLFGQTGRWPDQRTPPLPARVDAMMLLIPGVDATEIAQTTVLQRYFVALLGSRSGIQMTQTINFTVDAVPHVVTPPGGLCTWGVVQTSPSATHACQGTDYDSVVVVDMVVMDNLQLASAPGGKDDLLASDLVNLCYIAGELFQFVTATNTSGNRWELTELHRAKAGTEAAVGNARKGDRFVLIADSDGLLEPDGIFILPSVISNPTKQVTIKMTTGNPFQPTFSFVTKSLNLAPFPIADFQWSYVGNDVLATWQRCSRTADGAYPDDGSVAPAEDVSLPETSERYQAYFFKSPGVFVPTDSTTYMRKVTGIFADTFTYTAAMQTADSFDRTTETLYISIQQIGSVSDLDEGVAEVYSLPSI